MKETVSTAMPPCFNRWCQRFDEVFKNKAQRKQFSHYIAGLLGESERKNLTQMANNQVDASYDGLRHFLVRATWSAEQLNECRLKVMKACRQTKIANGFTLIIDDTGHRKSGNFTAGVGRQYIGEIGKTEKGIVAVTSHLYDGQKSLPLDLALYQKADSFAQGKKDPSFKKKPQLALELVDKTLNRGYQPGLIVVDSGYGNNGPFLKELEKRDLTYLAAIAKNRNLILNKRETQKEKLRIDEFAQRLSGEELTPVQLNLDKPKVVWVKIFQAEIAQLVGKRSLAIVMNAATFAEATDVDYFISNVEPSILTPQWLVQTYSQRNWVEVFYREIKGWLGFREYQVRAERSLIRHFHLVFCAYTFILWHRLTGGLRRQWANQPLNTFTEALEAFRTAISYRFFNWLVHNQDVFRSYKANLGFIWA